MGHRLVLELPQEVYEPLADAARRAGSTPEGLAVAWLAAVGRHAARDPVEPFIGAFRGGVPEQLVDLKDEAEDRREHEAWGGIARKARDQWAAENPS